MGMFDKIKNKASELASEHPDKVESISDQGIEKGGDTLDSKTGGKFADQVDKGQAIADEKIGE